MTDAQTALAQVREALDGGDFGPMLAPAVEKVLAHVEAQAAEIERLTAALRHEADCVEAAKAEIERLTKACRRAVIALAAATDQMPVFAADYAAVSDALKEQR